MLSDGRHSGSVTRDLTGALVGSTVEGALQMLPLLARSVPGLENAQPHARAMPYRIQVTDYLARRSFYDGIPRLREISTGASVLLISGCADNQVSLDGDVNGLFTEKLLAVWQEGASTGDHERLRTEIARLLPFTRSPQLSVIGGYSAAFVRQRPLTVAAASGTPGARGGAGPERVGRRLVRPSRRMARRMGGPHDDREPQHRPAERVPGEVDRVHPAGDQPRHRDPRRAEQVREPATGAPQGAARRGALGGHGCRHRAGADLRRRGAGRGR